MALEVATYINGLNPANPAGSDPLAQADDHFRLIKTTLKNTFPNIDGPVTLTDDQINALETRVDALEEAGGGTGGGGTGGITLVATLPTMGDYVGQTVFNEADGIIYTWDGNAWIPVTFEATTPTAPDAVGVVSSLPATATDGDVVFNTADNKLYERVNGVWTEVVITVNAAQEVADASITVAKFAQGIRPIEIVSALPTTNNSEGRLVYLTTDDKIYRYTGAAWTSGVSTGDLVGTIGANQIAANAIIAGKIAAGAISATEIAAGAISTAKLAAGAITASTIAAGAISADKIATNAITSDKIAANSIVTGKIAAAAIGTTELAASAITSSKISSGAVTAGAIAAGAITATAIGANVITVNKLASAASVETIATGLSFGLGATESNSGWTAAGYFRSTNASYAGCLGITTSSGVPGNVGIAGTSGGYGGGWYNYSAATKLTQFVGGYGSYAAVAQHISSNNTLTLANSSYAAYASSGGGKIYAVDGMGPFTGMHDGVTDEAPSLGDILVDHEILAHESISSSVASYKLSRSANQRGAIGVCSELFDEPPAGWRPEDPVFGVVPDVVNPPVPAGHKVIHVNALGEGLINVCGENGNIAKGDLIVTSNLAGKGMKQDDDIIRSYTVAKAREDVSFSFPSEVKQIACIYVCG